MSPRNLDGSPIKPRLWFLSDRELVLLPRCSASLIVQCGKVGDRTGVRPAPASSCKLTSRNERTGDAGDVAILAPALSQSSVLTYRSAAVPIWALAKMAIVGLLILPISPSQVMNLITSFRSPSRVA